METSSKKLKILYIITKSEFGGAQSHVHSLIQHFHIDYETHLVTGNYGQLVDNLASLVSSFHIFPTMTRGINIYKDGQCVLDLLSLIRSIKPDIIHAHSSKAGVLARIVGKICNVPTIFTAHGWAFSKGTPALRRIIALIIEISFGLISDRIICVSESDRRLALSTRVGSSHTLKTIHNGIPDSSILRSQPQIQPPILTMVARFNEQKDQQTLLKAIAQTPNFFGHLQLVGSGISLEKCKILARSLKILDKVSFLGDRSDISKLLSSSQIFVLSTHYEGLPISILEAMRSGLPIIASNVNGIPEQIDDGVTGLLVPPRDVFALSKAIQLLCESPDLRKSMGIAARLKYEQEFSLEKMLKEIDTVYKALC